MPPQSIPKADRARYLRHKLTPESLLRELEAALPRAAMPPMVVLIGLLGSHSEWQEIQDFYGPEFRREVEEDPEITCQIDELRSIGFEFEWGGYIESGRAEYTFGILRNAEAEARLRDQCKQR